MVTKNHVISLQNDRGTEYQAYIDVQNEIAAAYNELRNKVSKEKFGKNFADFGRRTTKKLYSRFIRKRYQKLNLKIMEVKVMGKFSKAGGREMPELNTSSLPDLVFAFLFFIMMVTSMREVTLKVEFHAPQATELQKIGEEIFGNIYLCR